MHLALNTFKIVVESTPLVSIDLVVRNKQGHVLLGERTNRPAHGYWFVPGGRILKDETFEQAFKRLTKIELGTELTLSEAKFIGPYEHHYDDNFSGAGFSTHYVVLGYEVTLNIDTGDLPKEQHGAYKWWSVDELLASKWVHQNTKDYFV
ncbi:GDP-mannose mannosyl hydrolase [Vibrio diabolicus]|uniref:GDP-mannose mannosyl hydrolase n=1 Tax=Vibrio diabolicus TaxID=50719 RepID=UPI0037524554